MRAGDFRGDEIFEVMNALQKICIHPGLQHLTGGVMDESLKMQWLAEKLAQVFGVPDSAVAAALSMNVNFAYSAGDCGDGESDPEGAEAADRLIGDSSEDRGADTDANEDTDAYLDTDADAVNFCDDFEPVTDRNKALIFASRVAALSMLEQLLDALGLSYLRMDGKTPLAQR